jgi:Bifunctional DNA primase/polymerase, N-terminal
MLLHEVAAGVERGWAFLPVNGKQPIQKAWQKQPRPTLAECERWARRRNVGLRTGQVSGVVVVDLDNGCDTNEMILPDTVTVITGSGGRHLYYQAPDRPVRNSVGKLGQHIDVRGDGGFVVFVGSVHPDTGEVYRWQEGFSPDDIQLAPLPAGIVDQLARDSQPAGVASGCTAYGLAALEAELDTLRATPEGRRNHELNRVAFVLGQLIAGGELDGTRVQDELMAATDLPEREARATIASGLKAGLREPRSAPTCASGASKKQPTRRATVLVPGPHLDDKGNYCEVGEGVFARQVVEHIPEDRVYLRGTPGIVGEILGNPGTRCFAQLSVDGMRAIAGDHVRPVKWAKKPYADEQVQKVLTFGRPLAALALEAAPSCPGVRRVDLIVPFPAHSCKAGWNPNGVFYDEVKALEGIAPQRGRHAIDAVLGDLLIDFPFKDEASRQNFIGLMLTLLLRPSIDGNVPLSMVLSSLERTGKTKLIEEVLGGILLGYPTPAMQLTGNDEEIDKRVVGMLLKSKPVLNLDNIRAELESAALASLLTTTTYQGRVLGGNAMPELRNRTVLIASGNNVRMSSELAKRSVPIVLQPCDDAPERRSDFRHRDLRAYVREKRRTVLECLLGMIANWEETGQPAGEVRLGGFES